MTMEFWLQPLATFTGIVVAASMVMWQQRATARANLKLKLFETLRSQFDSASDKCGNVSVRALRFADDMESFPQRHQSGMKPENPRTTIESMIAQNAAMRHSVADLMILLEAHDIVSEHFQFYCRVLACACDDVSRAWEKLFHFIMTRLPIYVPEIPETHRLLTELELHDLKALADAYRREVYTVQLYISDIQKETQNLLLGGLFRKWFISRKATRRVPADPRFIVISTDAKSLPHLRKIFMENHPAIRRAKTLENEASARADAGLPPL